MRRRNRSTRRTKRSTKRSKSRRTKRSKRITHRQYGGQPDVSRVLLSCTGFQPSNDLMKHLPHVLRALHSLTDGARTVHLTAVQHDLQHLDEAMEIPATARQRIEEGLAEYGTTLGSIQGIYMPLLEHLEQAPIHTYDVVMLLGCNLMIWLFPEPMGHSIDRVRRRLKPTTRVAIMENQRVEPSSPTAGRSVRFIPWNTADWNPNGPLLATYAQGIAAFDRAFVVQSTTDPAHVPYFVDRTSLLASMVTSNDENRNRRNNNRNSNRNEPVAKRHRTKEESKEE